MLSQLDAFFTHSTAGGGRFCLHHTPPDNRPARGALLFIHPFAEEMNKSRRMTAMACRALASDGWAVLQIDLLGCGDSSGDFSDASWQAWIADVQDAASLLRSRHPDVPLWLWGLRAGALLACAAAPRIDGPLHFLFWQPVLQGKVHLQQFVRLKAAAQLADGGGKAILAAARADMAAGRAVEIGGYLMSAGLSQGLEAARTVPPPLDCRSAGAPPGLAVWLEVSREADASASPATLAALADWRAAGWSVAFQGVQGPAFWQTTEIEDAPALVLATQRLLAAHGVIPANCPNATETPAL